MNGPQTFVCLASIGFFACGGAAATQEPAKESPRVEVAPPATKGAALPMPANSIRRSQLRSVLASGPGSFLQRVTLDDNAVFAGGKFHGFRVQRLNDAEMFRGVDLKAGDVVTRINGFPIEHPEEALEAFKSLAVASELRVDYERDGVPRELRYSIVDDEPARAPTPGGAK